MRHDLTILAIGLVAGAVVGFRVNNAIARLLVRRGLVTVTVSKWITERLRQQA